MVLLKFSRSAPPRSSYLYPYGVDKSTPCPFCALPPERVLLRNDSAIAFRDAYPVGPGHTLVIPQRHVASLFDTTPDERAAMFELLEAAKQQLAMELGPAGYNIGINDGAVAGQTVGHLHIHLIPRYPGDRPDPRGGIRWVIPEKADYWTGRT
jgi:diadenosine tetraphosphate (Ap4A) HIT family hydrolase